MNFLSNKQIGLLALLLVLWTGLIYANTFDVPFYFDDAANIEENSYIHLQRITLGAVASAGVKSFLSTRPVANISFALNHYFHQDSVAGYHALNILIHSLAGVFVFLFFKATLWTAPGRHKISRPEIIAFLAAFLWLVHPIQTQTITYVVQRMNSLAALFYIASMYCYVRGRISGEKKLIWSWFAGSLFSGFLALGSKEIAATLPFFIFLYEWYFFQDLRWDWLKKRLPALIGLLLFTVAVIFVYFGKNPFDTLLATYVHRKFSLTERVFTEFRVILFYLGLLILPLPSRLSLEHDFALSHSLFSPITTVVSFGALVMFLGLAIYLAKRERLLSFCILWFLGNLVIESSVIGLEILFEHRLYLPSMFFFLLIVLLVSRIVKKEILLWSGFAVVICLLSYWTIERNNLWRNPIAFWQESIRKARTNPRPYTNLGLAFYEKGMVVEAISYNQQALKIDPFFIAAHNNLGVAYQKIGRLDEAMNHFLIMLKANPTIPKVHNNLGNIYARKGNFVKATTHLQEALRLDPSFFRAHNNLGNVLQVQGKYNRAISHYQQALRIRPNYEDARYNMGVAIKRASQAGGRVK